MGLVVVSKLENYAFASKPHDYTMKHQGIVFDKLQLYYTQTRTYYVYCQGYDQEHDNYNYLGDNMVLGDVGPAKRLVRLVMVDL